MSDQYSSDGYGDTSPNSPFGSPDPYGYHGMSAPQVEMVDTPAVPSGSAREAAMPPADQLSEQDYRHGDTPGMPDRYIDDQDAHVAFYLGMQAPPAYPA